MDHQCGVDVMKQEADILEPDAEIAGRTAVNAKTDMPFRSPSGYVCIMADKHLPMQSPRMLFGSLFGSSFPGWSRLVPPAR
jgi:hypothetical protein